MSLTNIYVANVPQGNQQINNTQPSINGNFKDISQLVDVNHVGFNVSDTFGKHNIVDYITQPNDPSTSSTEMVLYSKVVPNTTDTELFYRYPSNGSVIQLTGSGQTSQSGSGGNIILNSSVSTFYFGYQYLSDGILMKFGANQIPQSTATSSTTFSFPVLNGVPEFTSTPFIMQCSLVGDTTYASPNGIVYITPISPTQWTMNYKNISGGGNLYWMAIGI